MYCNTSNVIITYNKQYCHVNTTYNNYMVVTPNVGLLKSMLPTKNKQVVCYVNTH